MLVCEGGIPVQGVLQRREALSQSRPCSDGERSAGSTIQGQVCRQLGTTPVGEGSELIASVDVILTNVSEAGVEGVHDGSRQATGQGGVWPGWDCRWQCSPRLLAHKNLACGRWLPNRQQCSTGG